MKITLLCSCGLLIESGQDAVLVDAVNGPAMTFKALPEDEYQKMLTGEKPYEKLPGLYFTHRHLDHMDVKKVSELLTARSRTEDVSPAPGVRKTGCITVTSVLFPHTPVPTVVDRPHYVLLTEAEGKTVYITADADIDAERHRQILNGKTVDAAFWNGQYLSYPETRALLKDCAKRNYIYHIPEDESDGICRKCVRNLERYPEETAGVVLMNRYPTVIEL